MEIFKSYFEGDEDRKTLARMLNGMGRGVNARLDVPLVVLNDLKWAAIVFSDLADAFKSIAFETDRPDVYKVLAARMTLDDAKYRLHAKNKRAQSLELQKKYGSKITTRSNFGS